MSDKKRTGDDAAKRFFRSDRVSMANGKYYFSTREGTLEGPYDTRAEAEAELMLFIRRATGKDIYGSIIRDDSKKS